MKSPVWPAKTSKERPARGLARFRSVACHPCHRGDSRLGQRMGPLHPRAEKGAPAPPVRAQLRSHRDGSGNGRLSSEVFSATFS